MYSWLAFIPVILIYGSVVLTWILRKFFRGQASLYDQPMVDDDQQMLTDEQNALTDNYTDQLTDDHISPSSLDNSDDTQKTPLPEEKIATLTDDRHNTHDDDPPVDKNKCKTD